MVIMIIQISRAPLTSTSASQIANIITTLNKKSYSVDVQSRPMIVPDANLLVNHSKLVQGIIILDLELREGSQFFHHLAL